MQYLLLYIYNIYHFYMIVPQFWCTVHDAQQFSHYVFFFNRYLFINKLKRNIKIYFLIV